MKVKILSIIFLVIVITSCSKKDGETQKINIQGKWKLKEILADPGDGSGIFHAVVSNKTLEFLNNGTVISNGSICSLSTEATDSSQASYSLVDSTINSESCTEGNDKIYFEIINSSLILKYQCIEACMAKFTRE